jgi:hypothetical protein
VAEFLDVGGLSAEDVVATEVVRERRITAGKVAINAVMAGCLPSYMPVLIAVVQALCEPEYSLHGASASTGGSAPLIIVNGPVRARLGMEPLHSAFASANRANATIGRAVRLILMNVLGNIPGQMDRSTLGHPGKVTFCIAEDEEDSPWRPVAQERGVTAGASVTNRESIPLCARHRTCWWWRLAVQPVALRRLSRRGTATNHLLSQRLFEQCPLPF